jgi:hypothetical protein
MRREKRISTRSDAPDEPDDLELRRRGASSSSSSSSLPTGVALWVLLLDSEESLESERLPKRASALEADSSTLAASAAHSRLRMDDTVRLLGRGGHHGSAGHMDGCLLGDI